MIAALPNVTIMGQPSAATNGTITTVQLPGGFGMNFTGMRLVNPDGSEFHGIGLVPDIPVDPTPAQFAAGEDPELQAAITHLLTL
jgi:C-terminal processing protease CtpA/Prc